MDQEFHILFNVPDESDDDDEKDDDEDDEHHHSRRDDDDGDGDFREKFKNHVKRAFVRYSVTDEIKIRKQIEIISPVAADIYCNVALLGTSPPGVMSCVPAYTGGGLQWEPASAPEDKKARAKATGPKNAGGGSGKTSEAWGYSIWPMDFGIYVWMDLGISTQINM